jgi:hypothetical protein
MCLPWCQSIRQRPQCGSSGSDRNLLFGAPIAGNIPSDLFGSCHCLVSTSTNCSFCWLVQRVVSAVSKALLHNRIESRISPGHRSHYRSGNIEVQMFSWSICGIQGLLRETPERLGNSPQHWSEAYGPTRFQRETGKAMGDLYVSPGVWANPSFAGSVQGPRQYCGGPSVCFACRWGRRL